MARPEQPIAELSSPPRPALALRVGVVGHRPGRLQHADLSRLEAALREILATIKEQADKFAARRRHPFAPGPAVLRALSPLAEGTDRVFADVAVGLEYELCVILPFAAEEFEKDFSTTESVERFRDLKGRARTVFALDGRRGTEPNAYAAAGSVVINQSDLLIAVWDGHRENKIGGTEHTLDIARGLGLPTIWVDAYAPHRWQIVSNSSPMPACVEGKRSEPTMPGTRAALRRLVRSLLKAPAPIQPDTKHSTVPAHPLRAIADFYAEKRPGRNPAFLWKLFRNAVGGSGWPMPRLKLKGFEQSVIEDWPRRTESSESLSCLIDSLRPYYAWADKVGDLYADRYRSGFLFGYFFAVIAVVLALLPIASAWFGERNLTAEIVCIVAEGVTILLIVLVVLHSRSRRWHERWIDYRYTAELIRHIRLVIPLGGGRPLLQMPAHFAMYGNPRDAWSAWYARAVERAIGLPSQSIDPEYLARVREDIDKTLEDQKKFHQAASKRCDRIVHRLHIAELVLLSATLACCLLHALPHAGLHAAWLEAVPPLVLSCACAAFPALGAALAGISNQGEFRRVAKRSGAMARRLDDLHKRVRSMKPFPSAAGVQAEPVASTQLTALANEAASVMTSEVLDWRIVFLDRPMDVSV